ncbi:hypothetical protein COLSTE_01679 [Collinsella stercoris DSM 13279]|uniref:Uncharacterized protein n=1 Tax=Collinsella stercoris DSM 13279 TaxID=445975 RepID=B6GC60_9ACTN|nr:hypothetical protein COLSTE_01679 [Collinsella stercoris DSM 13279]
MPRQSIKQVFSFRNVVARSQPPQPWQRRVGGRGEPLARFLRQSRS